MLKYFITGIGTDVGKTIISGLFVKAFNASYWKPVQAGLAEKDEDAILQFSPKAKIHLSTYYLKEPMSPHGAAELEDINIDLQKFKMPVTDTPLIVEGAGGLMVPLNEKDLLLDLIKQLNLPVICVSKNYLGSINHTLLTIEVLKQHNIVVEGIVFNGDRNESTERFIKNYSHLKVIAYIQNEKEWTEEVVEGYCKQIRENLKK